MADRLDRDARTDEELVRAFQRGDADAFAVFVERHGSRLYRMARVWLFDGGDAADAVQETLARSYRGLGQFRFRAEPSTWLMRVCRNVCHEANRHARRTIATMDMTALIDGAEAEHVAETDAGSMALTRLARLPPRQRDTVVLRVLEGLSVAETARVMGCREGTVKAHLHKALTRLKIEWNDDDAG